jgi:acetyl esterase
MKTRTTAQTIRAEQEVGLPVFVYRPTNSAPKPPLVLHLHGGSFLGGSLETGRMVAGLLAEAGAVVVSADYATEAEQPFPHALKAAFAALQSVHKHRAAWADRHSPLFVAGEEAGGNLAACLALMARDQGGPVLAGQILLSPMLDPCLATASVRKADAGPVGCRWADGWHRYLGSAEQAAHPYAAPSGASRLAGLAPALVLTAEDDPMHDESLCYAARLRAAGVLVQDHSLSAPTGWPCALCDSTTPKAAWSRILVERFQAFFAVTNPLPSTAAHLGQGVSP